MSSAYGFGGGVGVAVGPLVAVAVGVSVAVAVGVSVAVAVGVSVAVAVGVSVAVAAGVSVGVVVDVAALVEVLAERIALLAALTIWLPSRAPESRASASALASVNVTPRLLAHRPLPSQSPRNCLPPRGSRGYSDAVH